MFRKSLVLLMLVILLAGLAVGCGTASEPAGTTSGAEGQQSTDQKDKSTTKETTTSESTGSADDTSTSGTNYPITITDDSNTQVTLNQKPERIVSIIPSTTEIAFALGLGDLIVGVSDNDDYPAEAANKEKIGGFEINFEKIVSLNPDIVLGGAGITSEAVKKLRELGITVIAVEPTSIDEVYASIALIAKATDTMEQGQKVIAQMKAEHAQVTDALKGISEDAKPKVWVELDNTLYTTGKGTFMDQMVNLAGGINIAGNEEGWPQFTPEKVIELNPSVILVNYDYIENAVEQVKTREGWGELDAVKNNRVYQLDPNLVSRPGPRITQGLIQIAKFLHPDRF